MDSHNRAVKAGGRGAQQWVEGVNGGDREYL